MGESRVLPTEPGWWWVSTLDGMQIVYVMNDGYSLVVYGGAGECFLPVAHPSVNWLAPVPSREAVEAAVAALGDAKYEILEYARGLDVNRLVLKINNAIAGLTGLGGA